MYGRDIERIGRFLLDLRRTYPKRIPSEEQEHVEALIWMLKNQYRLSVLEIFKLVDEGWKESTIRAFSNSKKRPDIEAAKRRLNVARESYPGPEPIVRATSVKKTSAQEGEEDKDRFRADIGDFLRITAKHGVSIDEALDGLVALKDFMQEGIGAQDLKSFMVECKKVGEASRNWTGWPDVVQQFLWMWNNEQITQVEISALRLTLQKLDQKGIKIGSVEDLAMLLDKVLNTEVKGMIEEASNLKGLREQRRREEREHYEFRKEADNERRKFGKEIEEGTSRLEKMQEHIEKAKPLLNQISKLAKMGIKEEEITALRETVQKKYNRNLGQFLVALGEHNGLSDLRSKTKQEQIRLKDLQQRSSGYENLLHIHDPLLKKGHTAGEIRGFVNDAMQVVNRSKSLQEARDRFRTMPTIDSLRQEEGKLKGAVEDLRKEETRIRTMIDGTLERVRTSVKSSLATIDGNVAKFVERLSEATFDLDSRSKSAQLVLASKVELDMPENKPLNPIEQHEKLAAGMGVERAFNTLQGHPLDRRFLQYLILAAYRLCDKRKLYYEINLGFLQGELGPEVRNAPRMPLNDLLSGLEQQISMHNGKLGLAY